MPLLHPRCPLPSPRRRSGPMAAGARAPRLARGRIEPMGSCAVAHGEVLPSATGRGVSARSPSSTTMEGVVELAPAGHGHRVCCVRSSPQRRRPAMEFGGANGRFSSTGRNCGLRVASRELSVDRKLDKLDDANLAQQFAPDLLYNEAYFKHYEDSLEWYFDPELCKYSGFEDYQRLVLYNDGKYRDWDCYQSTLHTYEKDLAYVQYCEAMEKETKWIEDYLVDCSIPANPWERIKDVAHLQALKIAAGFPNVSPTLVSSAFAEHMWSVMFDFSNYMGLDGVYFEIWKRVAKQKMDFREALSELYQEKMFPLRSYDIELELEESLLRRWSMKENYDAYVASIGDLVSDDQALPLIAEAVKNMCPKSKNYVDYARKKLEVAKEIGLIMDGFR